MKKNLFAAFEQSKEGAEEPFCACETIAGYVTVSGRKCQVTVKVSAEEDEWLDDEASIKANNVKKGMQDAVWVITEDYGQDDGMGVVGIFATEALAEKHKVSISPINRYRYTIEKYDLISQ